MSAIDDALLSPMDWEGLKLSSPLLGREATEQPQGFDISPWATPPNSGCRYHLGWIIVIVIFGWVYVPGVRKWVIAVQLL